MEKPLVSKKYKLVKFPGKGGWTYTIISEIPPDKKARFGWVRVKGLIDDYELKNYKLMPMGNGRMFLPVRADIRKKIGKKEGDWVKVVLFHDVDPLQIPDDFLQCLRDEPAAYEVFHRFNESNQKYYLDWIYSSKKDDTRVERIAIAIERIRRGLKFLDTPRIVSGK